MPTTDRLQEVVVLVGLPGSGKSTFAHRHFGATHLRISRDVVKTPHRERVLQYTCLGLGVPFVADNTHPDPAARAPLVAAAKAAGAQVVACFFPPDLDACRERNARRIGRACVPEVALRATLARLVAPTRAEGFDAVFHVHGGPDVFELEEVPHGGSEGG